MKRSKRIAVWGGFVALVAAPFACRSATEVTLDLSTDGDCARVDEVDIFVASDPASAEARVQTDPFPNAVTHGCQDPAAKRIGTLVVTPSGDSGAVVVYAALDGKAVDTCKTDAKSCIVARRFFSFVEHRGVTLPITLQTACIGVPCDPTSTCYDGQCVDAHVDCTLGDTCSPPGVRLPDGGVMTVDAGEGGPHDSGGGDDGGADSGTDGGVDAGMDAGMEAGSDAGMDASAGALVCPSPLPNGSCQGGPIPPACIVVDGEPPGCCYPLGGGVPGCKSPSSCTTGYSECCSSSNDCASLGAGYYCCATTPTPMAGTRLACGTLADCMAAGGPFVCNAPSGTMNGCPPGKICPTLPATPYYGTPPAPTVWRCQ